MRKKMQARMWKNFAYFGTVVLLPFLTNPAFSKEIQDHDLNLGMKFKGEMRRTNNGLEKTSDHTPEASVGMLARSELVLDGKVNDFVDYSSDIELIPTTSRCMNTAVKWAWARVHLNDFVSLSTGCHEINQGGWDGASKSLLNIHASPIAEGPFPEYAPSFEYGFKLGGELTLQILNDINTGEEGKWNSGDKLAFNLDWRGEFAGVEPLVQLGSYDSNKSMFANVGLRGHLNSLSFRLDILNNMIADKVLKTGSTTEFEAKVDSAMSVVYYLDYTVPEVIVPYAYAVFYDKKQHTTDLKYNTRKITDESVNWDDNGTLVSAGAKFPCFGENFWAYLAYDFQSGKFQKSIAETQTETLTVSTFKIGTMGVL